MKVLGDFSFMGVRSDDLGIHYIPSPANLMWRSPTFGQRESTATNHAGGYYYGSQVDIRELTLECYFEDIPDSDYERVQRWIHRDNSGELIFDDRPFVVYDATVWKISTEKVYCHKNEKDLQNHYGGTISIFFRCYQPFGRMKYKTYKEFDKDHAVFCSGILEQSMMPPPVKPDIGMNLIYNPGTEPCETVIRIGGKAPNGVTLTNSSGDVCKLLSLPESGYLEIDGVHGTVKKMPEGKQAFEYHDDGYIELDPCTPYEREVSISTEAGSNIITFIDKKPIEEWIGRYIYIESKWYRLAALQEDPMKAVVNEPLPSTGMQFCMIAAMNELDVQGEGAVLNKLEVDYTPLIR